MEPIGTFFGIIFGALVLGNNPEPLPTCEEVAQTNPAVYRLQHGGFNGEGHTGAKPMLTCRKDEAQ